MSPLPSRRLSARESLPLLLCVVHSCAAFAPPAPMPKSRGGGMGLRRVLPTTSHRSRVLTITANEKKEGGVEEVDGVKEIAALKQRLVAAVRVFKAVQARDGAVSVDFGVKGGELDGGGAARAATLPACFVCTSMRVFYVWGFSLLDVPPSPSRIRTRTCTDTRAPRNLASAGAFYAVSEELGRAADNVTELISDLQVLNVRRLFKSNVSPHMARANTKA